jgi:hypothetical protein
MPVGDWLDLPFLKFISQHTSAVLGVLLSIVLVSRGVEFALGAGWLRTYVEYSERAILVAIFFYFPVRVVYDLWREIKARVREN